MNKHAGQALLAIAISACLFAAYAGIALADTRVGQQLTFTGIQTGSSSNNQDRWSQIFEVVGTTTVKSIAIAAEKCTASGDLALFYSATPFASGSIISLGTSPAFTFSGVTTLDSYGGIPSYRWTHAGASLSPGYYAIMQLGAGSCSPLYPDYLISTSFVSDGGATVGLWAPGASEYRLYASDYANAMVYTICSDNSCTVTGTNNYQDIDWGAISFPLVYGTSTAGIATSSPLWNSITFASSTVQCETGNIFSSGLCAAGSYLFVPNPQILNSYAGIPTILSQKFPFSWVYGVSSALTGGSGAAAVATSTYSINLANLGIGSTSPMGNILPNFTAFSEASVKTYIPAPVWATFQALIVAGLWLLLGFDIYATVRRRHSHT